MDFLKVKQARSKEGTRFPRDFVLDAFRLGLILASQAKRNGIVEKPLKTPRPCKDDHIPAHVRRAVWERRLRSLGATRMCGGER
jgi:hypothetical protein